MGFVYGTRSTRDLIDELHAGNEIHHEHRPRIAYPVVTCFDPDDTYLTATKVECMFVSRRSTLLLTVARNSCGPAPTSSPPTCSRILRRISIARPVMNADPTVTSDDHDPRQTQTTAADATRKEPPAIVQTRVFKDMDLQASDLTDVCAKVHARVEAFLRTETETGSSLGLAQEQAKLSLGVIEEALLRYNALHTHVNSPQAQHRSLSQLPPKLRTVYILSQHPFREVDDFVDSSASTYHLSVSRYAKPMRESFADYLSDEASVRAIFVGTRRTDPHGAALQHFDPTDNSWPTFMRIHPVIDWHYQDVWMFIRALGVPYCRLYDMGYTSLGGTTDTHPNPALKQGGGEGFRPAYELFADAEERLGRDR
nr:putative fad synthase [Quercus suber]